MWMGMKEAADDEVSPNNAIDWFVSNGSDEAPSAGLVRGWEVWFGGSGNVEEYVGVVEMELQLRLLAAPRRTSREMLEQDAAGEPGVSVG
jgi:hypothetical protein